MKKMISVILALIMVFSCFSVLPVLAADGNAVTDGGFTLGDLIDQEEFSKALNNFKPMDVPAEDYTDIDAILNASDSVAYNKFINESMFGLSVDFLYNDTTELQWRNVNISKDDLALGSANINVYLKRVINQYYGGSKLYTAENATKIANFIGHLLFPNYRDVTIVFPGTTAVNIEDFYGKIVDSCGLSNLVQKNWCDKPSLNIKPLMSVLGVNHNNMLPSEYTDGYRLSKKIVRYAVEKIFNEGPLKYVIDLVWSFARTYHLFLYEPMAALLNLKIVASGIDAEEFRDMTKMANLLINNCNTDGSSPSDTLQIATMPLRRFGMAKDTTEVFMYLVIYCNINLRHKNNNAILSTAKENILSLIPMNADEKAKVGMIYDGLILGNTTELISNMGTMFSENLNNIPSDLWDGLKRTIIKFLERITYLFDNIVRTILGEKNFG